MGIVLDWQASRQGTGPGGLLSYSSLYVSLSILGRYQLLFNCLTYLELESSGPSVKLAYWLLFITMPICLLFVLGTLHGEQLKIKTSSA